MRSIFVLPGIAVLFFALQPALPAQDAAADATAIDEAIAGLRQGLAEKSDVDIAAFAKKLGEKFKAASEKQVPEILKLLRQAVQSRNPSVRETTLEALVATESEGAAKILLAEIDRKPVKDDPPVRESLIRGLGRLHQAVALEPLLKLLKDKDNLIIAGAAEALSHYKDAKIDAKKQIVEEILKIYAPIESKVNKDPRDTTAREKLKATQNAFEGSLKALTAQSLSGAFNWQKWWNDTGKKAKSWS